MKKTVPAILAILILGIFVGAAFVKTQFKPSVYTETDLAKLTSTIAPTTAQINPTASPTPLPTLVSTLSLTLTSPASDITVSSPNVTVRGKSASRAQVYINEKELVADASGNFSAVLTMDEGENLIIVTANDDEGNVAEKQVVVTYEAQE
jgi:hypothetical protein